MMFLAVLYPIPNFADTNEKDMVSRFTWLGNGGYSLPYGCRSKERVAILIPYRDREKQLRILLSNLHPLLYRQGLEYRIYVIEQVILVYLYLLFFLIILITRHDLVGSNEEVFRPILKVQIDR